jgi:hypothetical protein
MPERISLSSRLLLRLTCAAAGGLLLVHVLTQWFLPLHPSPAMQALAALFDLDGEYNIAAAFSGLILLATAALLLLIAVLETRAASVQRAWWWVLCGGFVLMAWDEMFKLHENLGVIGTRLLSWVGLTSAEAPMFTFPWTAAGLVIVLGLLAAFLPFLLRLPTGDRRRLLFAGAVYLAGALEMDLVNGWYTALHGMENLTYALLVALEEGLEMAGVILMIAALLRILAVKYPAVTLVFGESSTTNKKDPGDTVPGPES